ncbi:MAG: AarF/UbiB family protein [Chloroflexi bacterium]|nr:AarF/UbiB family protein [Chloroflexota bacterium]
MPVYRAPDTQLQETPARPPYGRWRRAIPLAGTVIALWLRWRWLRLKRRVFGAERMQAATRRFHRGAAEAIVRRAIRQQGLIIKTCQFLGSRADVLMEEYVVTLSLMQDQVPPRPWIEMRSLIERELGAPLAELYAQFDPQPVAAASLAQVYRARTHEGVDVAVKVQYPEIDRIVQWDLQAIRMLANIWARFETVIDFRPIVDEMSRNAPFEVDFIHEGRAAERLAALLSSRDDVVIPHIYWERSSRRVLTMDYIDGIKISDIAALEAAGVSTQRVADSLTDLYNTMILRHGMFHADPHPGNLFVLPGDPPRIGLVDFGITKELSDDFREQLIVLTSAIIGEQPEAIGVTMEGMGFRTRSRDDETYAAIGQAFLGDVLRSGKAYADQELVAEINARIGRTLRGNPLVDVPGDVILIARVMGLLSGLGRTLNSETDLLEALLPYLDPDAIEDASVATP